MVPELPYELWEVIFTHVVENQMAEKRRRFKVGRYRWVECQVNWWLDRVLGG